MTWHNQDDLVIRSNPEANKWKRTAKALRRKYRKLLLVEQTRADTLASVLNSLFGELSDAVGRSEIIIEGPDEESIPQVFRGKGEN